MSVDDWRNDSNRAPWVRNSLLSKVKEMKARAAYCRKRFNKSYDGELANYIADACDEAANVFQRKLDECAETVEEGT